MDLAKRYPKYYKAVPPSISPNEIDTYVINMMFPVDDPSGCILHARKKLLVPGVRSGGKSLIKDVEEARDTLTRFLYLMEERAEAPPEPSKEWVLDSSTFLRLMAGVGSGQLKMEMTEPGVTPINSLLPMETFHLGSSDVHFWPVNGQGDTNDGWIEWHPLTGNPHVLPPGIDTSTTVDIHMRGGSETSQQAGTVRWDHKDKPGDVTYYRVSKKQGGPI